ncbi:hypothetical protein NUU61_009987 [Penicillium alfredii]|uniref:Uncharacterized protein n=1 Tax=Penicillium alfredii TaxID=1506179 RepID=A0A9W9EH59_9EURO|nr:uncharacterized protein NUU61_009987 [Penicillium alfredii]KAJ5081723.1 hypothetical protein NUU61_009987 [Penicillium alfredii]
MKLLAFGSNGSGQLGIGHTDDVSQPTPCLFLDSSEDRQSRPAESRTEETEIVKKNLLAQNASPDLLDEIVHIATGGNHTLVLTARGHVYAAGCNLDGRCGPDYDYYNSNDENSTSAYSSSEKNLLNFRRVVLTDPVTGTAVRTFKHVAATWEGSILVSRRPVNAPESSPRSENAPNSQDTVYVLGSTPKGELGLGSGDTQAPTSTPTPASASIPAFPPHGTSIVGLASGMGHAVAILCTGEVYGWGAARKGQLGDGNKPAKILWTPTRVDGIPFRASGASCGREFTVVFGDCKRGEFVVLGDRGNRWGVLDGPLHFSSVGDTPMTANLSAEENKGSESYLQQSVEGRGNPYTSLSTSWNGVYVHTAPNQAFSSLPSTSTSTHLPPHTSPLPSASSEKSDAGLLIAWGRNDRGQLPPPNLPTPIKLAVGSEHALALLGDGQVAAFGWGEHGNCGPDTDVRGNVAGTYNVVALPGGVCVGGARVVGVGAGCATSWVMVT